MPLPFEMLRDGETPLLRAWPPQQGILLVMPPKWYLTNSHIATAAAVAAGWPESFFSICAADADSILTSTCFLHDLLALYVRVAEVSGKICGQEVENHLGS